MNPWQLREKQNETEKDGATVLFPKYGFEITVGRMCDWNADYRRAIARVAAQPENAAAIARTAAKGYTPTQEDADLDAAMMRDAFAEGCIRSWKNVTGPDGKPFKFTPMNARKLLSHFPDVYAELRRIASDGKTWGDLAEAAKLEVAAGN